MGRGSPPATDKQKIEFVSPSPSPLRLSPARPPSSLLAPLCLARGWGGGRARWGAHGSTRLPGTRQQGRGSHSSQPWTGRRSSQNPSGCLPRPGPRGLQTTLDRGPSQESRPKDLLFPEIFRFSGHSLALPGECGVLLVCTKFSGVKIFIWFWLG